ncbi:hypothetical protein GNI_050050 [Gregarina niphandrodes]|uniref:Uncharacterized protein n=1 Tax=Gregarina niphandrodes TaxID=110365 RepID=A0A023B9J1_GRENI|nr:hypothetical protein GNI_050050 [Gregarina niphandrodes]EZG72955.1 hypothetical protein GNI_050050 [Gregarina niphandrodes]|eukprot:XP_011129714.1 hypothetical protein GNI_050050 [Gregarina niphandrodes]
MSGAFSTGDYSLDEIREMRLQLLNCENTMLRRQVQTLQKELTETQHKLTEMDTSFELLSDMLVQCIKDLQTTDAKTIVSQIINILSKVHDE